jgi:hypothetical protein
MPIAVHLRNGQVEELRAAQSCSWNPASTRQVRDAATPRWLVCRNERGDVIATYKEWDVVGYQAKPAGKAKRFVLPALRKSQRA